MKQVQQNYRSGKLQVSDVPAPLVGDGELLVATRVSLISAGTERQLTQLAKSSLAGKALARPDLVSRVLRSMRREGLKPTLDKVFARLDTPIPLGYSLVGDVIDVGRRVDGFPLGARVACAGAGFANHAEINAVPKNLSVLVPSGVDDDDASFVALGAIALQGVRQAAPTIGECVVVFGLGLIGLLTVDILKASGCRVIGFDPNAARVALALELGADMAVTANLASIVADVTGGHGADAVIVAASTKSNEPINLAAEVSRIKGRIVVLGLVGMAIDRDAFYKRELDLRLSMSYGPGRGDPAYEQGGIDYPLPYVRWTEQRNMAAFLQLVADGRVRPKRIVTHRFAITDAESAYALLDSKVPNIATLLTYPRGTGLPIQRQIDRKTSVAKSGLGVGFIGFGNYAKGVLLPKLKTDRQLTLTTVVTRTGLSAHHATETYGFARAATDAEAIFDDDLTDTVFIATRHDSHADLTARALAADKHVFCEKPLAITMDGLARVFDAAAASSGVLTIGFNRRFAPSLIQTRRAFEPRSGPLMMTYRVNAGALAAGSWVLGAEGGGRVLGAVCHFVDALTYLSGALPVDVRAFGAGAGGSASILIRFADGSVGTIVYAAEGDASVSKEYIEVFGQGSIARLDDFTRLTINSGGRERTVTGRQDKGQAQLVAAFLRAARGEVEAPISLEELEAVTRTTIEIDDVLRRG